MAVALTAPSAFRITFDADPARHLRAAELLAAPGSGVELPDDARERLPAALLAVIRDVGLPNGLAAVGYGEADVPHLVAGALQQQRLLATAPLTVTEDDLAAILSASMRLW
jgi:alcohol dehydrogenase class IV